MRVRSDFAAAAQLSLLTAFLLCLIWPAAVPDPFHVGDAWSWSLLSWLAAGPILLLAFYQRQALRTSLDVLIGLYVIAVLATWTAAFDRYTTLIAVIALSANVALFLAAVAVARRSVATSRVFLIILVLAIAILEILAADFHFQAGALSRPGVYPRPAGWSGYPELGLLAAIAVAILVAASQAAQPWWSRAALLVLTAVSLLELIFLYSRVAWVSVAAIVLAAGFVALRTRQLRAMLAGVLVILTLGGAFLAVNSSVQRLIGNLVGLEPWTPPPPGLVIDMASPAMRTEIWRRTLHMIGDHWFMGVGLGNFQAVFESQYNPELNTDGRRGVHAHNLWLHQAAEVGVIGGAVYMALWAAVLVLVWKRSDRSLFDQAFFYIIVAVAVHNLATNMFFKVGGASGRLETLTWLCFGVIAGLYRVRDAPVDAPAAGVTGTINRWRRPVFAAVCALIAAGEIYGLFVREIATVQVRGGKPVVIRELGDGVPIAQTFDMIDDGLRQIRVQFASDQRLSVHVACQIFRRGKDQAGSYERLIGWTKLVPLAPGRTWYSFTIPTLPASDDRAYKFEMRLLAPVPPDRGTVGLVASLDDALAGGVLTTDGKEQWGDLVFDAHGVSETAYAWFRRHTEASLPAPLKSVPIQLLALLIYNVALGVFAYRMSVATLIREPAAAQPGLEREDAAERIGRWRTLTTSAVAATAIVMTVVAVRGAGRSGETVTAIDLVSEFDGAAKRSAGSMHQTFQLLNLNIDRSAKQVIFAHPVSQITWKTRVPANARLQTFVALIPWIWDLSTDGVVFRIGVSDGHAYTSLSIRQVDPKHVPEDRRWIPVDLDLAQYAGRDVDVIFNTDFSPPGKRPDPTADWAIWGEPRIVVVKP